MHLFTLSTLTQQIRGIKPLLAQCWVTVHRWPIIDLTMALYLVFALKPRAELSQSIGSVSLSENNFLNHPPPITLSVRCKQ